MTNDLISREAALEILMRYCPDDDGSCSKADVDPREMLDEIENLPAVDAAPVVHGRWEFRKNKEDSWCADAICTACKNIIDSHVDNGLEYRQKAIKKRLRYCPNCGAKMDKEANY